MGTPCHHNSHTRCPEPGPIARLSNPVPPNAKYQRVKLRQNKSQQVHYSPLGSGNQLTANLLPPPLPNSKNCSEISAMTLFKICPVLLHFQTFMFFTPPYCTLYKIIYCLWFGRPGRPQPTAWVCDTGGRELYYADFDIAPFSRADHYIWYIIIQYIFCHADSIYRTSFARLSLCRIPRR